MKKWVIGLFSLVALSQTNVRSYEFRDIPLQTAADAIARLDGKPVVFPEGEGAKKISVSLEKLPPREALEELLETAGFTFTETNTHLYAKALPKRIPASEKKDEPLKPVVEKREALILKLSNILAKEIETNVKTYIGDQGSVSVNTSLNALILQVPTSMILPVTKVVEQLDKAVTQVFIEAKVVETNKSFSRNLGIQWGVGNPGTNGVALKALENSPFLAGAAVGIGTAAQIDAKISAGEKSGNIKIISSPKITTLNGVAAVLESSTTFNIRTLAPVQGTSGGSVLAGGLQPVKAGLTLRVTPHAISDTQVRLDMSISKSDPDYVNAIDNIPGISDNSASTSLIVADGQLATIGGLQYQTNSLNVSGFPFLSRIPIIGILFGSNDTEEKDRELLIFLTPKVLGK